jgi:hypothetical protein
MRAAACCLRHARKGAWTGLIFLVYLAAEILCTAQEEPEEEEQQEEAGPDEDAQDAYAAARALLGLPLSFSEDELTTAYRRAIRKAHPDTGGTAEAAQAVNAARSTVMRERGWKV